MKMEQLGLLRLKLQNKVSIVNFFISPNKIEFSELNQKSYYLYRVYDLKLNPLNGSLYINPGNVLDEFDKEPTEIILKS